MIGLLGLLVLTPLLFAASCVLNKEKNVVGWNINFLEQQLKDEETFVFYYGTDRCPNCQEAKKALKESSAWQDAVKNFKTKQKKAFAIYWYSEYIYQPQGKKRREFDQKLIKLLTKYKISKGKEMVESGVPLIIFFKEGKNINQTNAWKGPKQIDDLVKKLKELTV